MGNVHAVMHADEEKKEKRTRCGDGDADVGRSFDVWVRGMLAVTRQTPCRQARIFSRPLRADRQSNNHWDSTAHVTAAFMATLRESVSQIVQSAYHVS